MGRDGKRLRCKCERGYGFSIYEGRDTFTCYCRDCGAIYRIRSPEIPEGVHEEVEEEKVPFLMKKEPKIYAGYGRFGELMMIRHSTGDFKIMTYCWEQTVEEFSKAVAEAFGRDGAVHAVSAPPRHLIFDIKWNQVGEIYGKDVRWEDCIGEGLNLEFGVRDGNTIRDLAKSGRVVYGFDWFKGLPHEDGCFPKGACQVSKKPAVPDNVILVEGLFSDTLESFLEAHRGPVSFVNIDCDLYAPSIFVLHSLVDRFVTGSKVALSAMTFGFAQRRAWDRFIKETGQKWELLGKQHAYGEVYVLRG